MTVPLWLFLIVLIWGAIVTFLWLVYNPLPFPDRGHRCFAVPDEKTAKLVVSILAKFGRLKEHFTFDPEQTHQTLLSDNTTVIISQDEGHNPILALNSLSIVVSNPKKSAQEAAHLLKTAGFETYVHLSAMPEIEGKVVILESDAFLSWVLVFRRHILAMGKPPNMRKLFR
jgi:hypothetical protein